MRRFVLIAFLVTFQIFAAHSQRTFLIVRGNESYPPMEMRGPSGLSGYHVELVNAACASLALKPEWRDFPWPRATAMVESGEADAITYIAKTPERDKWAVFLPGNVLSRGRIGFLVRKDRYSPLPSVPDPARFASGKTILVVRNFNVPKSITGPGIVLQPVSSMQQLVDMLSFGRADAGVLNLDDFSHAFKDSPAFGRLAFLEPALEEFDNYIAFSRAGGHHALAARFERALSEFRKTDAHAALRVKYFGKGIR